jgi:HlyD family secretion protein
LNVQSAQLSLAKSQEALTQAETAAADYTVVAPFSGTIATVPVNKYDQASSGTTIATLITDEEYADLSLNEADVASVQVGQPVTLTFDALPNVTMQGTVATIDPVGTVTQGVVTYDVRISFNEENSAIKPGMTFEATIITSSVANAVQVPSGAVTTVGNQSYVQVATLKNASSTMAAMGAGGTRRMRTASSTATGGYGGYRSASSTSMGSTTNQFAFSSTTASSGATGTTAAVASLTVASDEVTVTRVPVTVGISNDTMVQIVSGLTPRQFVVTGTTSGTKKTTTTSTNLLSSLFGGSRRTTGTAGATGATTRTSTTGGTAGGYGGYSGQTGGAGAAGGPPGGG